MTDLAAAATRGTLEIRSRAVESIVLAAARSAGAVAQGAGGLAKLTGRGLPQAEVTVRDNHARVSVVAAVPWPSPAAVIAGAIRQAVAADVTAQCGYVVDTVDVEARFVFDTPAVDTPVFDTPEADGPDPADPDPSANTDPVDRRAG